MIIGVKAEPLHSIKAPPYKDQPELLYAEVHNKPIPFITIHTIFNTNQGVIILKSRDLNYDRAWSRIFHKVVALEGWSKLIGLHPEKILFRKEDMWLFHE